MRASKRLGRRVITVFAVSVVAATVVFAVAALWSLTGIAGLAGRLPRNRWAGVRTDATMASDTAWTLAQRIASPGYLGGALVLLLGGLLALFNDYGFAYALAALVLGLLAVAVVGGVAVRATDALPAETGGCSSGCCSGGDQPAGGDASGCAPAGESADPAADCGASSCGSCALNGLCTSEAHPTGR